MDPPQKSHIEITQLGGLTVPRLFVGLWQTSSPSWGSASMGKMKKHFSKHVNLGFTAFDMADHYGDAELLFGRFRAADANPSSIICADKWCVFDSVPITQEFVHGVISQRLQRTQSETLDLLQVHWQDYAVKDYIPALKFVEADERVLAVGLVNFDTERIKEIVSSGVRVVSNQIQFSLIDSRPEFAMIPVCEKHNIKLLTYGTLCGGFLAEKWHGQPEPETFDDRLTPSHRKYLEMINIWGGWELFQSLLQVLSEIANKHNVTIPLVATRWVLDHECVGAVIVGARLGVSEHAEENLKAFGWRLDGDDLVAIGKVQEKSHKKEIFKTLGDCGAEYRQ